MELKYQKGHFIKFPIPKQIQPTNISGKQNIAVTHKPIILKIFIISMD